MREKIKTVFMQHEKIIVLLFIIIAVATFSFNMGLEVNDELWNFSNIYKMSNGYTIYKDLNVIITPLFFYIGNILFKIMENNYFVFRIYNVLLFSIFYFLIYMIYRTLNIKTKRSIIYLIIMYVITYDLIILGASYNTLSMNFCLLGVLLILKNKPNWVQGIIVFLIFMTKQNIGVYYTLGYFIYQFVKYKNLKKATKEIIPCGMIAIILTAIYLLYLGVNQNLYHCINYTFLGIQEFGSKNFTYDKNIYILLFIICIYPILIWMMKTKKLKINQEIRNKTYLLISFGVPSLLMAYPLIEGHHVIFASILTMITFSYVIEKSFLEELTNTKIISKINTIIIIVFVIGINTLCCYENISYGILMKNYNYYDLYYGAIISNEQYKEINQIINYITQTEKEGKEVIILSCYSNLYMNILQKNNGKMDLPFMGNLGREGSEGLIKEISNLRNVNLLLPKKHTAGQESKEIREYIMNHYERIGKIEHFLIYKVGY